MYRQYSDHVTVSCDLTGLLSDQAADANLRFVGSLHLLFGKVCKGPCKNIICDTTQNRCHLKVLLISSNLPSIHYDMLAGLYKFVILSWLNHWTNHEIIYDRILAKFVEKKQSGLALCTAVHTFASSLIL